MRLSLPVSVAFPENHDSGEDNDADRKSYHKVRGISHVYARFNPEATGQRLAEINQLNYMGFRITESTNNILPSTIESSALMILAVVNLSSLQFRQARITSSFLKLSFPASSGMMEPELGELPP